MALDKIQTALFNSSALKELSKTQHDIIIRYQAAFSLWLETPFMSDNKIRDFLMNNYGVSKSQAYIDIANIKMLLSNVRNAGKEWQRYTVIEMLKKAYEDAERFEDAKAMVLAADKIGKYTRLDKEDREKLPWHEIKPAVVEETTDPTILDIDPIENVDKRIAALEEKYGGQISKKIEDITYIPVDDEDEESIL